MWGFSHHCHAELVSASMPHSQSSGHFEAWTLKQVQGDDLLLVPLRDSKTTV
jgi:hypothetical protein